MTTYIALLRAINLGKRNKIKMAELRELLVSMDLKNVQTYIQSGNVIFDSEVNAEHLTQQLEQEIQSTFGFPVPVILRTATELEQIIRSCPYSFENLTEGESIHVSFLAELPSQEKIDQLTDFNNEIDEYQINAKEVYMYFGQNLHKSKLPNHLKKLDVPATLRNWKTVMKLSEMVGARE
ncbi:DUF1697 domain-containing protein [Virgibacillus necropolis]|uniref:DUF1697 domain-containing protein n=1 Tax=Virgibacillus necropolis TaxID=163877 RepID=UPI0038505746